MENGVNQDGNQSVKMGATGNTDRLAVLQAQKKEIEEKLCKRNNELRQLCIQEAELTGVMPLEIPLEPGESPPTFRRRVGTSYQLSQNLINNLNNKEESISALELEKQIQANMAEAALGLANEPNSTKTIRRQHKAQYQYHKQQYNLLEEKISFLKTQTQQKQKKKPRPPEQEDSISVATSTSESLGKSCLRHSMRSLQAVSDAGSEPYQRLDTCVYLRPDDVLPAGLYRLSLNGYKNYMERRESSTSLPSAQYVHAQSNPNIYQQHQMYYPSTAAQKMHYYPPHTNYRHTEQTFRTLNPHQIEPHQQYEHEVFASGLGGHWKRTESGEMVWYNSGNMYEVAWQRDRRFGSLDRRKHRRLHKRTSPLMDTKPAPAPEHERVSTLKPVTRNGSDSRQLIRTQSLGSVGAQTVDSVWPSDDGSLCENRKPKQKEWYETSLDGPFIPRSQSTVPNVEQQEVQKVALEIPAESKPSPRVETNMELFRNNVPKNCTVLQAGVCKPYREETKPFEMSDFYKYSTKFKKSPQKNINERNLDDNDNGPVQKSVYQQTTHVDNQGRNNNPGSPSKTTTLV